MPLPPWWWKVERYCRMHPAWGQALLRRHGPSEFLRAATPAPGRAAVGQRASLAQCCRLHPCERQMHGTTFHLSV
jgi:hypothetical protein